MALVPFLLALSVVGVCVAVLLLRKGRKADPAVHDEALAREAMRRAMHKLPMKCRFVVREGGVN